ncbi:MAG: alkylmercury lyase family protein [Bryobacteraceae bacterium]|nr:alkylmercury lyase family protein [Bryobacteraceae bacterium]
MTRVHHELIRGLIDAGRCPSNAEVAAALGMDDASVETALRDLAAIHGLVLHPHICAPWLIHPFSLTPSPHWVTNGKYSWWAPCLWCACGVATLVGGAVQIHTRYEGESEPLVIDLEDGVPAGSTDIFIHFAIPPARAWDNVHQHCSMVLPFRSADAIGAWCARHGFTQGQAVPLAQTALLARRWYGTHASPQWRKWTVAEAQAIFTAAGLTTDFWRLEPREGQF